MSVTEPPVRPAEDAACPAAFRLLCTMSHDLRSPLNTITGYAEMLLEDARTSGRLDQADSLERILDASENLCTRMDDVLDVAHIEAGRTTARPVTVDLAALGADVVAAAQRLAERRGATLDANTSTLSGPANVDAKRIRHAVLALVDCAASWGSPRTLHFEAALQMTGADASLRMTVSHTAPADGSHERETTSRMHLQVANHVCQLLGGRATVHPEPTRFSVTADVPLARRGALHV